MPSWETVERSIASFIVQFALATKVYFPMRSAVDQMGVCILQPKMSPSTRLPVCQAYARGLRREGENRGWFAHAETRGREIILARELGQSTARLKDDKIASLVAEEVALLEVQMKPGLEVAHLQLMIRRTSIRGGDIKLFLWDSHQEIPYPAYRWRWNEVLSYAWNSERHINEGEVSAFNIMLRRRAKESKNHEMRYLAIVDSMVSRGAIGKGRSPSKPINKLLKQTAAVALASDQYPLLIWTISQWNFADLASRREACQVLMPVHIKFAGLRRRTLRSYGMALERFLHFVDSEGLEVKTTKQLDHLAW